MSRYLQIYTRDAYKNTYAWVVKFKNKLLGHTIQNLSDLLEFLKNFETWETDLDVWQIKWLILAPE